MRRPRPPALAVLLLLAGSGLAPAQTPAERAGARLEQELARDRLREAAERAGSEAATSPDAAAPGPATDRVEQLDRERTSLQPPVGRPEQQDRLPGERRTTGADPNVTR